MRGSNGVGRALKGPGAHSSFILIRKELYSVSLEIVSPRRNSRSRAQTSIFAIESCLFLVQMAGLDPAWPKPDPGQIAEIWEFGNQAIWDPK